MTHSEVKWTAAWRVCIVLVRRSAGKFLAPSLTLPVALDVGRQTFAVFNRLEWFLCVVAAIIWTLSVRTRASALLIAIACGIVLIESF